MPDYIENQPICECAEDGSTAWCDGEEATDIGYTYNMDIQTLATLINRFIFEALHSDSANIHTFTDSDIARMNSFLESIRLKQAWIEEAPVLDTSHASPRKYCLAANTEIRAVESDGIRELVRLLAVMRDSLIRSDSTRQGNGLNAHDNNRLTNAIIKTQLMLDMIVKPGADYVSSAPLVNVAPPGNVAPKKAE